VIAVLVPLELPVLSGEIADDVAELCRVMERRTRRFLDERSKSARIPEFAASNPRVVYPVLRYIVDQDLGRCRSFCEWGSGLGVVTILASLLGFEASGVEVEPDLVAEARCLAAEVGVDPTFHLGSFKPAGAYRGELDLDVVRANLGCDPASAAVVYAYPWPAEEKVIRRIFDHGAKVGSLLVTYHGGATIAVARRVGVADDG
jgi:hypothetical protein